MLKKCLASILSATLLLAALALLAPAAPAAAHGPLAAQSQQEPGSVPRAWTGLFAGLWQNLLGVFAAATCNELDDCAPDACFPELCPCNSDPCAENACNPSACTGTGGGTGPRVDPHG